MYDFEKMILDNKELILKKTQELIRIPSVLDENNKTDEAPFGKNVRDALDYMMNLAKEDGFKTEQDGGYAGQIDYGNPNGKLIGILCHLDVVPVSKGWIYPPFEAKIVDGKLYGRGSTDDKGPTMAAYFALKFIKDAGIKLKNNIRIILGTDEETGWRGVSHYFEKYPMPEIGFAPDADFPLIYGEKGRMTYDLGLSSWDDDDIVVSIKGGDRYNVVLDEVSAIVTKDLEKEFKEFISVNNLEGSYTKVSNGYELVLKGVAAHAMEPHKGINAGTYMCKFLEKYSKNKLIKYIAKYYHQSPFLEKLGLDYNDYEMGPITCNIGIMNISKSNSLVTLDLRYPVRYDIENFQNVMKKIAEEGQVEILNNTLKKPHYVSPDSDLVKKLYSAYLEVTGDNEHKPFTIGGGTYASMLEKGCAFGMLFPYETELAHQANEYLNIESLYKGILIYIKAILSLGEIDA